MSIHELTPKEPMPLKVQCPLCAEWIPVITLSARPSGRKSLVLHIEGNAVDWVTHLWSHQMSDC